MQQEVKLGGWGLAKLQALGREGIKGGGGARGV